MAGDVTLQIGEVADAVGLPLRTIRHHLPSAESSTAHLRRWASSDDPVRSPDR